MKISSKTVRDDFNDPVAVIHYARAAHHLGLWLSERILIERFLPDRAACSLLEAGSRGRPGRGRLLWELGYRNSDGLRLRRRISSTRRAASASERGRRGDRLSPGGRPGFRVRKRVGRRIRRRALQAFNGLMQIPGREDRRRALAELHRACRAGAPLLFHHPRSEFLGLRAGILAAGGGTLVGGNGRIRRWLEFGDRYFEDAAGRTFMHLPDRTEVLEDLAATGWSHEFDQMRHALARESKSVREFADECRFWLARRRPD